MCLVLGEREDNSMVRCHLPTSEMSHNPFKFDDFNHVSKPRAVEFGREMWIKREGVYCPIRNGELTPNSKVEGAILGLKDVFDGWRGPGTIPARYIFSGL
jgi:hypothetical protein